MKVLNRLFLAFFFVVFFSACKEESSAPQETEEVIVSTFYLIRHAEKDRSDPDDIDPELNQAGLGRAMHWAEIFEEIELDAIYTTDYQRTTMTAAPTSVKKDLTVKYYDPDEVNINLFKENNIGGKVLVVGHSNSTPEMVNQLLGMDKYGPMDDYDNGSLFIVQVVGDNVTDTRLHFNCNCPR